MEINSREYLWVEKYRPQTIADCILPKETRSIFEGYIKEGNFPNLLLSGSAGIGKTTCAVALCNDLGCDSMVINASEERGIDVLRTKITEFVTTVSLTGGESRKIVILDEADNMTPDNMSALRAFIEKYSDNAGFILTCNFKPKIIEPLLSRLVDIQMNKGVDECKALYLQRMSHILKLEGVAHSPEQLVLILKKMFPDFRRMINLLQSYSQVSGTIDSGIFATIKEVEIDKVFDFLKEQKWRDMREYFDVHANELDYDSFFDDLYTGLDEHVKDTSLPVAVLIIAEYQKSNMMVANKKINLVAMLTEMMKDVVFK